jgi:hypothetical protein
LLCGKPGTSTLIDKKNVRRYKRTHDRWSASKFSVCESRFGFAAWALQLDARYIESVDQRTDKISVRRPRQCTWKHPEQRRGYLEEQIPGRVSNILFDDLMARVA